MTESAVQSSAEIIVELNEKRPMRVLHVDDELDFLKVAKQCLEIEGQFQVDTARSVEEAMEKMKGESYDAVVSDFQMPGKDGLELLKELRQSGNTVPFVIFTGKGREEVAISALNLGADHYLNKTGNPETVYGELAHAIRQAVEKRESEERLKAIVENTSNVYYSHGLDHVLTYVSPQVREVFGYEPEEVLTNWQNLLTDNPVNLKGIELTQRAMDTGQRQPPYLLELVGRDGRKAWVEVHESPVVRNGKTVAMVGSITDITERRKAEEALRESEERYKDLFENAMDTILTLDLKGNVTSVNKAILRYGYKKEDVIGKSIRSFIPWNLWRKARDDLSQATKGKPTRNETKIRVPDGKAVVEYRSNPVVKNGKITGVQVILRDIADRKLVEEAHKSEEKFRCLVEETAAPVGICDLRGNFTYVNRALAELLGYSVEEMAGRPFRGFLHPKDRGRIIRVFLGAIVLRRKPYSFEFRALHRDGHVLHLMSRPTRFVINGKTVGFQAIIVDISDLKKAGEELRRFSSAVKTSLDGIVISDMAGRIVEVNDAVLRMFGAADKADLIGKSTFDLIVPEEREKALEGMKKALKEDHVKSQEYVVVTKQGSRLSVELTSTLMKDGEGKPTGFVGIVRDITERKKAEKTNRENQLKFERLFMYNPEPAVYLDSGFRILDINPRFAALFGYSLDEVRGKHINDVAVPEDRLEEARMLDRKAGNGIVYHDTVRKKKDGSLIPVSISAGPIVADGQTVGHVAVYKDISLLKKTEKELKEALERLGIMNEKLQVVGGLTRHDARNKLSTITGNVYLARKKLAGDSETLGCLGEMETAVQQVVKIFDFARTYEMLGVEGPAYVDVEKTIKEATSLFSDLKGVKIINECHGLTVLADSLLRQLFYNLVDNSLKYGQKITYIRVYYEKTGEDKLKLIYEDDGVGIPDSEKPNLFKEGYSSGGSTGHGLYLIKKMTEFYGWTIQETGAPHKGAQFTITIPWKNQNGEENYQLH